MLETLNAAVLELAIKAVRQMNDSPRFITWTWDTIKGFGATKALKSSYVFLFVVPVVARALQSAPESIAIPFSEKEIELTLSLPFSWVVLFASACLASLGNIIYATMCPALVKQYEGFPDYRDAERDGTHLRETVKSLALTAQDGTTREQLDSIQELYNDNPANLDDLDQSLIGHRTLSSVNFYFVRDSANLAKPVMRLVASIAYFGAFVCLGVIAIQNIWYVVDYLSAKNGAG